MEIHGKTAEDDGVPITDELVAELAEKAQAGYDVDEMLRRRGGRPPIGSAAASVSPCGSILSCATRCSSGRGGPRDDVVRDPQGAAQVPRRRLTSRGRLTLGRLAAAVRDSQPRAGRS